MEQTRYNVTALLTNLANGDVDTSAKLRGGGAVALSLDDLPVFAPERSSELVKLDKSLEKLVRLDRRQAKIVELRFFAGLTVEQGGEVLGISAKTVKRDCAVAKAWLYADIESKSSGG